MPVTKTSSLTINVDSTAAIDLQKKGFKLCIARMVENDYTAIWDIRNPSPGNTVYTFTNEYSAVVAADTLDSDTNLPTPLTADVTVATGQTIKYKGGSLETDDAKFLRAGTKDAGSRSFTYQNLSGADGGTPTKTRVVVLQALTCNKSPVTPPSSCPSNVVAVSDTVDAGDSKAVAPCWNVYGGPDKIGGTVDSIALWWTQSKDKSATGGAKIKGDVKPDIESNYTTYFSMDAGADVTATFDKSESWSLAVNKQ